MHNTCQEDTNERSHTSSVARGPRRAVFLLVGILGFVPGITTHYGDLASQAMTRARSCSGIFQVSILHNIVHLLFGVAGLVLAKTAEGARTYLIGGGVVYLVLWLIGVIGGGDWIPANTADNWLHLVARRRPDRARLRHRASMTAATV